MLDAAFEALKTYDWGVEPEVLRPIDEAIVAGRDDAAARAELESRLAAVLNDDVSRDAKDFVCRKLMQVGTAQSVPALASLLTSAELSHMARYALERIPDRTAAEALRAALPSLPVELKIGVIGSLGARQEDESVGTLAELLGDADTNVARSAALALGAIRSPSAAKTLAAAPARAEIQSALTDGSLACAEGLLQAGDKAGALKIYQRFAAQQQPHHVRLAATRGVLACAGK